MRGKKEEEKRRKLMKTGNVSKDKTEQAWGA